MAQPADRISDLLDGVNRPERTITSPEGVNLRVRLASRGERMAAFALDLTFLNLSIILVYILAFLAIGSFAFNRGLSSFTDWDSLRVMVTLFLFISFIVRVMYFTHFELAWQGRTPGKRICGIRVIDRRGGPLTPNAVIARNLTREVEVFLPMGAVFGLSSGMWSSLLTFAWTMLFAALPFFNKDRLRAGDYIAGTMVIRMPRRALLSDLSGEGRDSGVYSFTAEQLSKYGAFELQVLEELLRRPENKESERLLEDVAMKITHRIGMSDKIPPRNIRRFLNDFYSAERAVLEHGQLFGHYKDDKNSK